MNKVNMSVRLVTFTLAMALGAATAGAHDARVDRLVHRHSIQGVWEVTVTLRLPAPDCTTAALVGVGPNPFKSLNTFHMGGTMSEWGTRSPPSTRGPGQGVWKRTGDDTFAFRLMFHSFDSNGFFANTMDMRSDVELAGDGQSFTGVSRFVFTDLSGNARNSCATLAGSRVTL